MNEPIFHPARLASRRSAGVELVELTFEADPVVSGYRIPGQFVRVKVDDKVGFFALASAPHDGEVRLLVKPGGAAADALLALSPPAEIEITAPEGKGYPIDQAAGQDVLCICVGSGLAPIRALVRHILAHRAQFGRVELHHGARTLAHLPYPEELETWRRDGVDVYLATSAEAAEGSYPGRVTGELAGHLGSHKLDPSRTTVFVCGMKPMVQEVMTVLEGYGLPKARVFQNF